MGNCNNKIEINAPIATVWKSLAEFHDISWSPKIVTSFEKVGDKKSKEVGVKGILNDTIHETLNKMGDEGFTFEYRIDDGPGPLSKTSIKNYAGLVNSSTAEAGTLVEWSSTYESDDENAVAEFCNPIYVALLGALKESLE